MLIKKKRIPILQIILLGLLPSRIKLIVYKYKGYKIGKRVKIGLGSVIIGESVIVEDNVKIGYLSVIRGRNIRINSFSQIGSFVYMDVHLLNIGQDVIIRENVLIGGNETHKARFEIGDRSHIRQDCIINTSESVLIGSESAIGGGTYIFTHSSWQSKLEGYPCSYEPVTIGDNVWISWDVFILPGVNIKNGVLVSAGSVITHSLPEKCIASGNPAKVVLPSGKYPRTISETDREEILIDILNKFAEYLNFYGFKVKQENTKSYDVYKIIGEHIEFQILNIFSEEFINDLSLIGSKTVLIIRSKSVLSQFHNINNDMMSLNIIDMIRYGSNEIGEELIDFLLKYGVKFKRRNRLEE